MKTYKDLLREFGNMNIDLDKARKNKIFKVNEKPAEKIIQALILQGFINIAWDVTSQGWEMSTQNGTSGKLQYWHGKTAFETLQQIQKKLRLKV